MVRAPVPPRGLAAVRPRFPFLSDPSAARGPVKSEEFTLSLAYGKLVPLSVLLYFPPRGGVHPRRAARRFVSGRAGSLGPSLSGGPAAPIPGPPAIPVAPIAPSTPTRHGSVALKTLSQPSVSSRTPPTKAL